MEIEVKCPQSGTETDSTRGSIKINGKVVQLIELTGVESKTFKIKTELEDGTHDLTIEHTYSENSTCALVINKIFIEDIDIGVLAYNGVYKPIYPEPWYSEQVDSGTPPKETIGNGADGSSCLFMGWEGEYTLQFSTPLYEWLLENI